MMSSLLNSKGDDQNKEYETELCIEGNKTVQHNITVQVTVTGYLF
jgi:hypothetical protein